MTNTRATAAKVDEGKVDNLNNNSTPHLLQRIQDLLYIVELQKLTIQNQQQLIQATYSNNAGKDPKSASNSPLMSEEPTNKPVKDTRNKIKSFSEVAKLQVAKVVPPEDVPAKNIPMSSSASDEGKNSDGFKNVVRKHRKNGNHARTEPIIGSCKNVCKITAAPRKIWMHVGRVAQATTEVDVIEYLKGKINNEDFSCEKLDSRGDYSSFKVGACSELLETLNDPDFWPSGVAVRRFFLKFRRPESPT